MTEHKSFKRLVRARMQKTGESYTAQANLLRSEPRERAGGPALATSDEKIRQRTGRGWEEWFELLDQWGAAPRTHREIARWVSTQLGVEPLAWNAQAVAGSYELARGLRVVGREAGWVRDRRVEDGGGPRRAALRRRRRPGVTRRLAARSRASRADGHEAKVGAL